MSLKEVTYADCRICHNCCLHDEVVCLTCHREETARLRSLLADLVSRIERVLPTVVAKPEFRTLTALGEYQGLLAVLSAAKEA